MIMRIILVISRVPCDHDSDIAIIRVILGIMRVISVIRQVRH